jgi:hypothetical protein
MWCSCSTGQTHRPSTQPGKAQAAAEEHAARWAARLEAALPGRFRQPDRDNFTRACRLAAELGLFG